VDLLMDAAGEHIEACEELVWSNEKERVEETSSFTYGKITLDATISNARPSPRAGAVLFRVAKTKGVASFDPEASLERLAVRLGLINQHFPQALVDEGSDSSSLQWLRDPSLLTEVALSRACQTATRWEELTKLEWTDFTTAVIPHSLQSALAKWVPTHVSLSGGLRVQVHYQQGRVPWIEARLQNFFGMATAPTLCQGRTPLQLHLLAPNKRAVQVTTDLQSFWDRHYPTLRKELMRRYPKHLWPEDGRHAAPPVPGKIR